MEFLKKQAEEESPVDFRTNLGIQVLERRDGYAVGEMAINQNHMNVLGVIHGGCLFSLADSLSGAAAATYGGRVTTVNGAINFLRPGKDTEKVRAEAKVIKRGKAFSVCDCSLFDDKGSLLATTTMTFYHLGD